jgi:tRNA G18 (ribose-2'-O)-methylase SpoU
VPIIHVDDPADSRLEDYRNVPDAQLIEERGIFVAEGRLVVRRLLEDGRFRTRSVLVTETALAALGNPDHGDVPTYVVPQWIINAITGFNIHRGCLAIGERSAPQSWQDAAATARRLVIVERVANADNIGSIFRNAAAFGADAVLLDATCTDPLYRKAIRTSMGATLRVPFARIIPWPVALRELKAMGWTLVALTPSGETTIDDFRLKPEATVTTGPAEAGHYVRQIAIVVGHEGDGLTAEALDACDVRARIPMAAGADSLNVATACAVALYELTRV